jgi:hypothetical protein
MNAMREAFGFDVLAQVKNTPGKKDEVRIRVDEVTVRS